MRVSHPRTLAEAEALIATGAQAVVGGTGHQFRWSQGQTRPDHLVNIVPILPNGINGLTIGAGTSLEDIRHAGLPLLSQACRDVGAPNIRRLATLGGNIGFGAGCLIPALLALDAELNTTRGPRPLRDHLRDPKGLILSMTLRPLDRSIWRKIGLRAAFTPAMIVSAGTLASQDGRITDLRLSVGGGIVAPQRLTEVETWLIGQVLTKVDMADLETRVFAAIDAPSCAFRSAGYRKHVAAKVISHGLLGPDLKTHCPKTLRPSPTPPPALTALSRQGGGDRWHTRPDMPAKVRGALPYLTDVRAPGMLVGRILRAAHPHAEILRIDTRQAEALPGVHAVVTHRDITGLNGFGIVFQDQPALCADKVRYTGDPVAAVAAIDAQVAEAALALIEVEYAPLPDVTDPEMALMPGAARVHDSGNLVSEIAHAKGDLTEGWAKAVHVVEDTYVTPRQMHGFMETEGGWAAPDGPQHNGILVCAGGQHGARDRLQLSRILDLPEDKIRVISSPTGGAFGGKDELTVQPVLALLARKSGRAVRLHLSRAESVQAGIKRNPMRIRMKTGCDATGRLVAQEVDVIADCGAYASLSPGVLETAMEHAAGPYVIENIQTRGRLAYTNNGTCGAFRGFGANQMSYAIECQMDRLAAKARLDPVAIRRLNMRVPGSPGFLSQRVAPSERLLEMLNAASSSPLWSARETNPDEIIGTGMALNYQGNGLGTLPEDEAEFALRLKGGKIEVLCGLDEMGQGLIASLHAELSTRLGVARDDSRAVFGDTGTAPDSGSTTASRGGYVVWRGIKETAPPFETELLSQAGAKLGLPPAELRLVPGGIGARGANTPAPLLRFGAMADSATFTTQFSFPKSDYTKGNARLIFAFATTLTRVAVNRVSGQVRVLDLEMHTAAGPVIDMASYLGQMEGGLIQGLGFTLTEDMLMQDGRPVTTNFDSYMMPTVRDVPNTMRITALEDLDPGDPYGPRGAGELGIGAVTPAIANAVFDAIGRWPVVTPFAPESLLDVIASVEAEAQT